MDKRVVSVKYSGDDETQVPLGVEGIQGNSRERSSSEFIRKTPYYIYDNVVCE